MASPQIENGFTRIANELLEIIIATPFPGRELRIILTVMRKTYGWNKADDYISLSQFVSATGMTLKQCSKVINRLVKARVILVIDKRGFRGTKKYKVNKDYNLWTLTPEGESPQRESHPRRGRHSPSRGREHSPSRVSTKDTVLKTLTKDTHQEECSESEKRFKEFWTIYPDRNGRKADQVKAHSLFVMLSPEDQTSIIRAVKNYAADEQILRGVGILDPANFIRRRDLDTGEINEPWREYSAPCTEPYTPDTSWRLQLEKDEQARSEEADRIKKGVECGKLKLVPRSRMPFESQEQYSEKIAAGKVPLVAVPINAEPLDLCRG